MNEGGCLVFNLSTQEVVPRCKVLRALVATGSLLNAIAP